jgi:hypothetical protein
MPTMNNKTMKDRLKQLDQHAKRVAELEKEFDLGNLSYRISEERMMVTTKIGTTHKERR